jgi:hypothetical protein
MCLSDLSSLNFSTLFILVSQTCVVLVRNQGGVSTRALCAECHRQSIASWGCRRDGYQLAEENLTSLQCRPADAY